MTILSPRHLCTIFLVACVSIGFLIRLDYFDSTGSNYYFVDVARDYIVSHHMAAYGEVPLTGSDGYVGSYLSSPMYYYILAFLLLLSDSIFFPGLINVALQSLCIVLVFFLAKETFGSKTACLTVLFFTFFDAIVGQSLLMWQPHLMQPFLLGSFYLLVFAYKKQKIFALYGSVILFACALMLHNSVLAIAPVYGLVVAFILFKQNVPLKTYIKAILSFIVPVLVMSVPVLIFLTFYQVNTAPLSPEEALYLVPDSALQLSVGSVTVSFVERFIYLVSFLFEGTVTSLDEFKTGIYTVLSTFAFLLGSILYIVRNKESEKTYYFMIFLSCVISASTVVAMLGLLPEFEFPVRYFTPVYALILILVAEMIVNSFKYYTWTIAPKALLVVLILIFAAPTLPASVESIYTRIHEKGLYAFNPAYTVPEDMLALADSLRVLGKSDGGLSAFDVRTFKEDYEDQYLDSRIWVSLEQIFNEKLLKVDDSAFRGFSTVKTPEHMFVRCISNTKIECKERFLRKYSLKYKVNEVIQATEEVFYLHAVRI